MLVCRSQRKEGPIALLKSKGIEVRVKESAIRLTPEVRGGGLEGMGIPGQHYATIQT